MNFASYDTAAFFDEMFLPNGYARFGARLLKERIESLPNGELLLRQNHVCPPFGRSILSQTGSALG